MKLVDVCVAGYIGVSIGIILSVLANASIVEACFGFLITYFSLLICSEIGELNDTIKSVIK